ncbi:MAG: DUF4010 domain-containing protein, partial [Patescibacteria group bacterium]|nr:DUF4010 domain-containing protein [Patescibacteria group bacterium]
MVFVILPLLPNQELTLLGVEGAFNPYQTWLMIIFVSGVSFVGYFLAKVVGGAHGIGLTGVLGGLVSSTAVTQSMANDSKKHPKLVSAYAFAAISASVVKCFRVLFEAWTIDSLMISKYAVAVLAVAVVGIMFITRWIGPSEAKDGNGKICVGSPLSLKPAIVFGLLYSFTVFVTRLMVTNEISNLGFGILGMVSGMADLDAITLSMSGLFLQGAVSDVTAWTTIVIAVISNLLFKAALARIFGSNKYFRIVSTALVVMALAGVIFAALSLR